MPQESQTSPARTGDARDSKCAGWTFRMSESKKTRTSAAVASTPLESARALLPPAEPVDTTTAPAPAAAAAVPSPDPSSTTTTRPAPRATRAARTTPATVASSLRAGMTTSKRGTERYGTALGLAASGQDLDLCGILHVSAPLGVADVLGAVLLGDLLQEEAGAAVRALADDRLLPEGEFAVRVAVAGPEGLAAAGALLDDLPLAALGAGDAGRLRRRRLGADLADVLALGVAGAAVEGAEAAPLEGHRPAAHLARRDLFFPRRGAVACRQGLARGLLDDA